MEGEVTAALAINGVVALGVIVALVRNGRNSIRKDAEFKKEITDSIETIHDRLEDPNTGLGALKKAVDAQELKFAETSSSIREQVNANRRDIDKLDKKH